MKIELFTSDQCPRCERAKHELRELVASLNKTRYNDIELCEINVLNELDYCVEMGITVTPSIALNGKLAFSSLPKTATLKQTILEQLNHE